MTLRQKVRGSTRFTKIAFSMRGIAGEFKCASPGNKNYLFKCARPGSQTIFMKIKSILTNPSGQTLTVEYQDIDSELDFKDKKISAVHAFCFYKGQLVIVYAESKGYWAPPGGSVEEGEDVINAVSREVHEETNMKVIRQRFIGLQDIFDPKGTISQTRSVCIVEPYGDFISDPDGDITEIKCIDPKEYKKYFDWGAVGERLMERALEAKAQMELMFEARASHI